MENDATRSELTFPNSGTIPLEKITSYLLAHRNQDDKSQFLAQAGFTCDNPEVLLDAIRQHAATHEAVEDGENEWGTLLRVEGSLDGPNGRSLNVVTIWIRWATDGSVHFVTLKPWRR